MEEATKLLEHISSLTKTGGVVESSIIKSGYVLLLYNNLEATISSTIKYLHDCASICKYDELSEEFKEIHAEFYHHNISKKSVKEHLDKTFGGNFKFPSYDAYCKKVTIFSGNIDVKSINDFNKKYGIARLDLRGKTPENILTIKNKRNKLAHGEESFKHSCRSYTIAELQELGDSLKRLLDKFIELIEDFVNEEKFKAPIPS
ncbi:TPA: MAE_28990/MAE_18760 family HEPN-like nuclease [Photobacterium damselae]